MDFSLAPITIQQMIIFLRVVEYGGFAKASGYLNMTQSAVSKSIARLERDLGITLFQRTTREIHLTEAGQLLYKEWKGITHALHDSYIRASSIQFKECQQLHIGILNTARPELYLWEIEEHFVKAYPDIKLNYGSAYMTDLEEELAKGHYDLIMIPDFERFIVESMDLCWKWAACSHANVIMSKSHPLAKRSSLKMADILYESFATLEKRDRQTHREDLEGRMASYHVKPTIVPGYQNAYEIKYLFRKQENAMIFIDEYFDCPDSPDLVKIPVIDEKNGIICVWDPNNQKPSVQKFIGVLRPTQK